MDHLIDTKGAASDALEAPNFIGEPSGTRTLANLIKSNLPGTPIEVHDDLNLEDLYTWD